MNIREYVDNPMGKGDSSIPNRKELIDSLEVKYQRLIREKGNKIEMKAYRARNKTDDVYFHLIIPSESGRGNSYDVVFKFSDTKREHYNELSISKYDVSVFSNSPSFAYTFAYVYEKNGLFISQFKQKLGKEFFRNAPEVRNRFGIINYEKYVYFGARFILDSKRLNRAFLDMIARPYSADLLLKNVRKLDVIMAEYRKAETKLKKKKNSANQESSQRSGGRTLKDNRSVVFKTDVSKSSAYIKKKTAKTPGRPKSNKVKKI